MEKKRDQIAILGGGNIGSAIANGLVRAELWAPNDIIITRRRPDLLTKFAENGFNVSIDNTWAVKEANIVVVAVTPQQLNGLLSEISGEISEDRHILISVVSGASINEIKEKIGKKVPVIRAMPNTAIAIGESMTCISASEQDESALEAASRIFDAVGRTLVIAESLMIPATALCACGIAFFLRAIRAASQGGIEIGFHAEDALLMAAQTAKGAASLLVMNDNHPEREVDKVTTPQGCTISGLNQMEHNGFSSALIKGIVTSAEKASKLYSSDK